MEDKIDLTFKEAKKEEEVVNLSKFDIQAFTDTQDFSWSLDNIKKEVKTGWKLFSVMTDDEIVAAVLMKKDGDTLFTKNTPIKMAFQGNGFSHQIKNFYGDDGKIYFHLVGSGHWKFTYQGTFSLGTVKKTLVRLFGDCHYPIKKFQKLDPLTSFGLSNEGKGEMTLETEGPVFLYFPEGK